MNKSIRTALAAMVLVGAGALTACTPESPTAPSAPKSASSTSKAAPTKAQDPEPEESKEATEAEQFKAFVAENGIPTEREAVKHVTKVRVGEKNGIFDSSEVFTDFTGDLMSSDQASGKLIASAFADWQQSENGLVTVYNADGDLLSNGNY